MNNLVKIIAFLFLSYTSLLGQVESKSISLTGLWQGMIYDEESIYQTEYKIEMYLHDTPNGIVGRSYTFVGDIFAEMILEGDREGENIIVFRELKIVKNKVDEGMEWCVKHGKLILKSTKDGLELRGTWLGKTSFSECGPGTLVLQNKMERA